MQLFEQAISLDPKLPKGHSLSSLAHLKRGSPEVALEEAELGDRLSQGSTPYLVLHANALAASGEVEEARTILEEVEGRRKKENVWLVGLAIAYVSLGAPDIAFERLEEAVQERVGWVHWLRIEPSLDGIREDARFEELLTKVTPWSAASPGQDL